MENTVKVLFESDATPQWYIALGDRWVGPLTAADVYEKVVAQEISWAHYVWKPGQKEWQRICDIDTFKAAVPSLPKKSVQSEVKEAATPPSGTSRPAKGHGKGKTPPTPPGSPRAGAKKAPVVLVRDWYLHYNDSQFGPFAYEEVDRYLRVGKVHGRVHAWKDGMENWERLEALSEFSEGVAEAKRVRASKAAVAKAASAAAAAGNEAMPAVREQREAPRRPLVARIWLANDESVITAVCRDISVGGMQVLTDRIPGIVGTKIRMNVTSTDAKGRPAHHVAKGAPSPFVAEGVIVRILEDGRGFSFRFERLPDESRRTIESYIASNG